jgi:hypothetical protein
VTLIVFCGRYQYGCQRQGVSLTVRGVSLSSGSVQVVPSLTIASFHSDNNYYSYSPSRTRELQLRLSQNNARRFLRRIILFSVISGNILLYHSVVNMELFCDLDADQ